jgi:hypothetical protein
LLKRKNIKYSEETRAKHRAVWLNRKHSKATLDKLRGRKFSDEHRAKLGTSVEVKNIAACRLPPKTGETVKYLTMTEAGQALSVSQPFPPGLFI